MEDKAYFSYLLRMWQTRRGNELVWMASLDDPHTGKRHSFTTLERLFAFLLKQTQASEYPAGQECDQGRSTDEGSKNDKAPQSSQSAKID